MKKTMLAWLCGLAISPALLAEPAPGNLVELSLKQQVQSKLMDAFGPRVEVREVSTVAQGQLLEVVLVDGTVMHMTPDKAHFLYRDELYGFTPKGPENITQNRMIPKRSAKLAAVSDKETVMFPAKGEQKALINVFTDIDCGYCQKLHQEIPRLNELGVTVRYMAYPRAGIKNLETGELTSSYRKINYVWCEDKRADAMTAMKTTQRELNMAGRQLRQSPSDSVRKQFNALQSQMNAMLNKNDDCNAPIAAQYELGGELGVTGTPAIVTEQGQLFPGYLPADELARRLDIL